ncbi:MAG: polysaccharide deacetylase family protein [Planctomycetota bacterium]|jgi:hypothetical protein
MRKSVFLLLIFLIIFFPSVLFAQSVSIEICDWQGGAAGAASISIDDSFTSCRDILDEYGFKGTYFLHHTDKFSEADWDIWRSVYAEGHEIGGHTTNHNCLVLDEETIRAELSSNKSDIITNLNIPEEEILSFAWPCGVGNPEMKKIANEFYVSARGYHFNKLEDKNPADFMNLKSLNTPYYHVPELDPPDYFQKADEAEELGLWVNYVFHNHCVDDGAIAYLATKDLWVAPIGRVIKYIKQRQNSIVTNIVQTGSEIRFELESSLDPYMFNEELTIKVSMDPDDVKKVLCNQNLVEFTRSSGYFIFNIPSSQSTDIRILKKDSLINHSYDILQPKDKYKEKIMRPLRKIPIGDGVVTNIWMSNQIKFDNLRDHKIKYLFVDIGNTKQNGTMETPIEQIAEFLKLVESYEKKHQYDFILLPYSEVNTNHYDINSEFKENFIAVYDHLISLGFDGVYVDIEPIRKGQEEDYLDFLKDLSTICPEDKILGVYAGVVDSESDNVRNNEWSWSKNLYRKVSSKVDLICVPGYDTDLRNSKDYNSFIRKQIEILSSTQSNACLMLAIPTHKREPETIENALVSYNSVINKYPQNLFIGTYIFAEWTTNRHEWDVFKSMK